LPPDKNPMFLEKRVYQGSSGRVYPLPFTDRISTEAREHSWQAVHLENEFIRVMVLPEIGGGKNRGVGQKKGVRFLLSPKRHQAGPRRAGRAVDFRRGRV